MRRAAKLAMFSGSFLVYFASCCAMLTSASGQAREAAPPVREEVGENQETVVSSNSRRQRVKEQHSILHTTESLFGNLEVTESNGIRYLFVDGVLQTAMYRDRMKVARESHLFDKHYWFELLPYFHPEGTRCLLIGLGGGLLPAILEGYGVETHAVEIDKMVVDVARQYFGYSQAATVGDGRAYLAQSSEQYHFIVVDAFAGAEFPYQLATKEFFGLAKQHISPSGLFALNLISKPTGSRVSASVVRTLGEVFPEVAVYRTESPERVQSLVCFARRETLMLTLHPHGEELGVTDHQLEKLDEFRVAPASQDSVVLTDGGSPLDDEWSNEAAEWRKRMIEVFGRKQETPLEERENG